MRGEPGRNSVEVRLEKAEVRRRVNRAKKKNVISIEDESRGGREREIGDAVDVEDKEEGTEDRPLWNPRRNRKRMRGRAIHNNRLRTV